MPLVVREGFMLVDSWENAGLMTCKCAACNKCGMLLTALVLRSLMARQELVPGLTRSTTLAQPLGLTT